MAIGYRDLFELKAWRKRQQDQARLKGSVMSRPSEPEWQPEYQRPGGHALEAPMFAPDDLIGSGISKPIMAGGKLLAGMGAGAGMFAGMAGMTRGVIDDSVRKAVAPVKTAVGQEGLASRSVEVPMQGRGNKLKTTEEGKRVYDATGALGHITPAQLGRMRSNYMAHMEAGTPGRHWYDESSAAINRWTGGVPAESDKVANALATTSSSTAVPPNLMYTNKAWNQHLLGQPIHSGKFPNNMGKEITRTFTDPEASAAGLKRGPFSAGLSVDWRGKEFASRPTHDIHDMRAWDIKDPKTGEDWKKGVPPAAHRFLDEQADYVSGKANNMALGGATDWNPYRAQAAAWISQKAKKEGRQVGETAQHYGYFAPEYQAQITREWVPSTRSGHLEELGSMPYEVRQGFSQALEDVNTGPQGIDRLARGMGALTDTSLPNVGVYEGATNPGYASLVGVGKMSNPTTLAEQAMDPASEQVVRSIAGAHGLVGVQDQSAYNYLTSLNRGGAPANQSNAFRIEYPGGALQGDDLSRANQRLASLGVHVPIVDSRGVRGLQFGDEGQTKDIFAPELRAALQAHAGATGGDLRWLNNSGGILPEVPSERWSSKPFISEIEAGGPKMVENFNQTMQGGYAQELLDTVTAQAEKLGLRSAPYYAPMMEALGSGGLPALKKLVEQGIVPAAVLGMLGLGYAGGGEGSYD
jgi:hypothetical protein